MRGLKETIRLLENFNLKVIAEAADSEEMKKEIIGYLKSIPMQLPVKVQPTNAELSQLLSMCKTKLLLYYTEHPEYIGGVPIDQLTFRIDKMQERLST
jgi:ribosomal protein L7Ae-like RNA K-turn-binding protein